MRSFLFAIALAVVPSLVSAQGAQKNPEVLIETNKGTITVRLFGDKAPISTKNFLDYAKAGFYEGTVFHRVIPGFMIQGGGFDKTLQQKPTKPTIKNEATNGLSNLRGTLAMARTGVVDSATSQFFINLVDNTRLDHKSTNPAEYGYAVFGEVVSGMEVVDAIAKVERLCPSTSRAPCDAALPPGMRDVPKDAIVIKKVTVK